MTDCGHQNLEQYDGAKGGGDYCHLHLHTEYSVLDGNTKITDVPRIAAELGQSAVAITDHGTCSGAFKFWKACKEYEVKPILGMEGYITPDLTIKEKDSPIWHIVLIAMNKEGRDNLFALNKIGWTDGFYRKPRIDYAALSSYNAGLIATSSCMAGEVARAIEDEDRDEAVNALLRYKHIFGDRFYVELQPGNSRELNDILSNLAEFCGIKTIVSVDSHYDTEETKSYEELLLIMQQVSGFKQSDKDYAKLNYDLSRSKTNLLDRLNTLWPKRNLRFDEHDLFIMSRGEVEGRMQQQGFTNSNELCDNTLEIAERCEGLTFKTGSVYLPNIGGSDADALLKQKVREGLERKKLFDLPEYRERAKEELGILTDKGFANYFLIVEDLIAEANRRNIYVGFGRGSAAGSLVAYALDITGVDPIKNGLLFFRFINAERNDFPDIDMDFEHTRRDEMKDYFRAKYGEALSLSTFSEFKAKGLLRSIARALSIPLEEVNAACKGFDTIDEYIASEKTQPFRARHPEVLPIMQKFEGQISGNGMHAAGVVIADRPMSEIVPIESRTDPDNKKQRVPVAGFDMNDAEAVGLIKFDFLGLNTLTVIHDCINMIKERHGIDIDWRAFDVRDNPDEHVLADLNNANTVGVFQMESSPYRKLLSKMGVDNFEDLVASNALVRPGAFLTVAQDYIARKKGKKKVTYPHPSVEQELKNTYGVYIYQEQVMQLAVKLGGFSWSEADRLRKIIGKKKDASEFAPYYEKWLNNASQMIGEEEAEKMWHDFEKHSGYSFNRSHAWCYSYLGYVTAWLKRHYPLEFIYALLRSEKVEANRMTYLLEARRLGIKIEPPTIQRSEKFTSITQDSILFGISDIKGVGFAAADEIISKRPFKDWDDFEARVAARRCNSRVRESLVAVDALREVSEAPRHPEPEINYQKYLNYPLILEGVNTLGLEFTPIEEIEEEDDGSFYLISGVVKAIKRTDKYVRIEIEDMTGSITSFGAMSNDLSEGEVVVALIGDKTMVGYARAQGLKERITNGHSDEFESFLMGEIFKEVEQLRNYGIGKLGDPKALVVPLQVREVTTKKGDQMAFAYVTDGEIITKVTIFPSTWEDIKDSLFDWVPVAVKIDRLRDGGYTINKGGVMNANKLLEKKRELYV